MALSDNIPQIPVFFGTPCRFLAVLVISSRLLEAWLGDRVTRFLKCYIWKHCCQHYCQCWCRHLSILIFLGSIICNGFDNPENNEDVVEVPISYSDYSNLGSHSSELDQESENTQKSKMPKVVSENVFSGNHDYENWTPRVTPVVSSPDKRKGVRFNLQAAENWSPNTKFM